ncbi:hypothetical protein HMPREF3039_00431 [Akkermansia sp. KLE1798]|nr:hypothetical protein HMPREF3039_00431 [Akkermansia sp. KLE1798]
MNHLKQNALGRSEFFYLWVVNHLLRKMNRRRRNDNYGLLISASWDYF